ncbi:hypothetical protein EDB86DRAFT_2957645 [Lactarius hatsudake]|nr:hypothetical protein EDB86DRAFT_2957645 [Lactarius hatsudake]
MTLVLLRAPYELCFFVSLSLATLRHLCSTISYLGTGFVHTVHTEYSIQTGIGSIAFVSYVLLRVPSAYTSTPLI